MGMTLDERLKEDEANSLAVAVNKFNESMNHRKMGRESAEDLMVPKHDETGEKKWT